jgi:amphi-Trp domain-containing protein
MRALGEDKPPEQPASSGGEPQMSDVKLERKMTLSRDEAAVWASVLSKAFARGGEVELPVGDSKLSLQLPEQMEAEFEVEVDGTEVQVELEFTWSTASAESPGKSSADD